MVADTDKVKELRLRGFAAYRDPETKELKLGEFNANLFARYILTRMDLICVEPYRFYRYEDGVWQPQTEAGLKKALRDILHEPLDATWTTRRENEYYAALAREAHHEGELNPNRYLLNLPNCTLDLEKMELYEGHNREDFSTIRIPIPWDDEAACPRFMAFLNEMLQEDQDAVDFLGEWFGYCLTTDMAAQKALVLYGPGSTVVTTVLEALIGKANVSHIPLRRLSDRFALTSIVGKTLNLSSENELGGASLNTEIFKAIVGGDSIEVEPKMKPQFSYTPCCKMVFAMNHLPETRDMSEGFFRRLMILPFRVTIPPEEQDRGLAARLIMEELPGILRWAVDGYRRLRKNGYRFTQAKVVEEAGRTYRRSQNPVEGFIADRIETCGGNIRTTQTEILDAYNDWAEQQGFAALSGRAFWPRFDAVMDGKGIPKQVLKSGLDRFRLGIRLRDGGEAALLEEQLEPSEFDEGTTAPEEDGEELFPPVIDGGEDSLDT